MKIFICGVSRSGKTHLASLLSEELNAPYFSASGWLHELDPVRAKIAEGEGKQQYIDRLTAMSLEALQDDPNICIDYCLGKMRINRVTPTIIEGLRNPRDFLSLYDPAQDVVIWLTNEQVGDTPATSFEDIGLEAIMSCIEFQRLIHQDLKFVRVTHTGPPDGLEQELDSILSTIGATKRWRL
jgi:hypothetical protein